MKRVFLVVAVTISVLFLNLSVSVPPGIAAQSQVKKVTKEVLKAYKNRDVKLLKKNASGFLKMAISESYFNDKAIQNDLKTVEHWDGKIRAIHYETGRMMGKKVYTATAYYADAPSGNEIYVVLLSSLDNKKWVFVGSGLSKMEKSEFMAIGKGKPPSAKKSQSRMTKNFSIEMASGDTFSKVSQAKVLECIDKLDDDNFFLILSHKDDFLQAAYSDSGYTVEYSEKGAHYTAKDLLSKAKTVQIFKAYCQGKNNWNKSVVWEKN